MLFTTRTRRRRRFKQHLCAIVASAALACLGTDASAQFSPAPGDINSPIGFSAANGIDNGPFSISRTVTTSAGLTRIRIDVERDATGAIVYSDSLESFDSPNIQCAFVNGNRLLVFKTESNSVDHTLRLNWVNLDAASPPASERMIFGRTFFASENPNPEVFASSDEMVMHTRIVLADSAISDVHEIAIYRLDTGEQICVRAPVNRGPGESVSAEVTDVDLGITWHRPSFGDQRQSCPLPAPNLSVVGEPVTFSDIATGTVPLPRQTVTISNNGTEPAIIESIANAAHFSVVALNDEHTLPVSAANPIVLATSGAAREVVATIEFNPGTSTGTFNETITLGPGSLPGDRVIACEGSAHTPTPEIAVAPGRTIPFGVVNLPVTAPVPPRDFTIRNDGELPLTVTLGSAPSDAAFTLTSTPAITGFPVTFTLPPGTGAASRRIFTVTFLPTAERTYSATIPVTTNDPDSSDASFNMRFTGEGHVPRAIFSMEPVVSALNYGEVEAGYRFGKAVRVRNLGDLPLEFDVEVFDTTAAAAPPAASGEQRFTFSQDPSMPGRGVRGPVTVTIPPTPYGETNFREVILRTTFDALLPLTDPASPPCRGEMHVTNIQGVDPISLTPHADVTVDLEGRVVAGRTLDFVMAIDRSGSMNETTGVRRKVDAVRSAAELGFRLLRTEGTDRAGLVQFNTTPETLANLLPVDTAHRDALIAEVRDGSNLSPSGATSISAGLLRSFDVLGPDAAADREIRSVLIVSDGKENTPATLPDGTVVDLEDVPVPERIAVHSLGIGRDDNLDKERLEALATRSGGLANTTGDFANAELFALEKFFLQVMTTLKGGTPILDPVYTVAPGESLSPIRIPINPADKEITFVLMFVDGLLPFEIHGPDGVRFPVGAPAPGYGQSVQFTPNAAIVSIQLPRDDDALYDFGLSVHVRHDGYTLTGSGPIEQRKENPEKKPVQFGLFVGALSNLRMIGLVSPERKLVGDPIQVTAILSEEGLPLTGASVVARTTRPNGADGTEVVLRDDGLSNDGAANDGEYGAAYRRTELAGAYSFTLRATGDSARGRPFMRELSLGKHVLGKEPPTDRPQPGASGPTDERPKPDGCCPTIVWWLRVIAVLVLVVAVIVVWTRRPRLASA